VLGSWSAVSAATICPASPDGSPAGAGGRSALTSNGAVVVVVGGGSVLLVDELVVARRVVLGAPSMLGSSAREQLETVSASSATTAVRRGPSGLRGRDMSHPP
jgi:hypothetical protein